MYPRYVSISLTPHYPFILAQVISYRNPRCSYRTVLQPLAVLCVCIRYVVVLFCVPILRTRCVLSSLRNRWLHSTRTQPMRVPANK
jgi:hypothetical protein